ncbi:50S ribosomal protein L4 [Candidatus Roizmanbacteria bacterium]|nr:50S ribosomal protein L4 [Candidatus Roizmanbacteria bacterium]
MEVKKTAKAKTIKTGLKKTEVGFSMAFYDIKGNEEKKIALPEKIFGQKVNKSLIAQYVKVFLANQRQGTVSTKTRGEVTGSTRKIYRQKGTGRARHGDIKAPIFVGGGIAFGPKPRDFSLKINKKQARLALSSSLSEKLKEKAIFGLGSDFLKMDKPKTSTLYRFLKTKNLENNRNLLIISAKDKNNSLSLSARNLAKMIVTPAHSLNAYFVLKSRNILVTEDALSELISRFSKKNEN